MLEDVRKMVIEDIQKGIEVYEKGKEEIKIKYEEYCYKKKNIKLVEYPQYSFIKRIFSLKKIKDEKRNIDEKNKKTLEILESDIKRTENELNNIIKELDELKNIFENIENGQSISEIELDKDAILQELIRKKTNFSKYSVEDMCELEFDYNDYIKISRKYSKKELSYIFQKTGKCKNIEFMKLAVEIDDKFILYDDTLNDEVYEVWLKNRNYNKIEKKFEIIPRKYIYDIIRTCPENAIEIIEKTSDMSLAGIEQFLRGISHENYFIIKQVENNDDNISRIFENGITLDKQEIEKYSKRILDSTIFVSKNPYFVAGYSSINTQKNNKTSFIVCSIPDDDKYIIGTDKLSSTTDNFIAPQYIFGAIETTADKTDIIFNPTPIDKRNRYNYYLKPNSSVDEIRDYMTTIKIEKTKR